MTDKEKSKGRGRPRAFDKEAALDIAQKLFHEHGYDGVGVAALAQAMGINPPSLYAAFGDKASLFEQVLARYAASALPIEDLLTTGAPPAQALTQLLREAARIWKDASAARIKDFLTPSHPDQAPAVADYMVAIMSGLSSDARSGASVERLLAVADIAGLAIGVALAH